MELSLLSGDKDHEATE